MVKVVNRFTHTVMWVADERINEYLEAGHQLASESARPIVEEPKEEPKEEAIEEPKEAPKVKRGRPKKK